MPLLNQSLERFICVPFAYLYPSTFNTNRMQIWSQRKRKAPELIQVRSGIPSPSSLHIGENRIEPPRVQAALLSHVLHEEATAGGKHGCPVPAQPPDLGKTRILSADLSA
jgi:hypothetical protein